MNFLLFFCGLTAVAVLGMEYIMWYLFQRRVSGLHFPHEADSSSRIRFFTMGRMRICAIVHATFTLAIAELFLIFIW